MGRDKRKSKMKKNNKLKQLWFTILCKLNIYHNKQSYWAGNNYIPFKTFRLSHWYCSCCGKKTYAKVHDKNKESKFQAVCQKKEK